MITTKRTPAEDVEIGDRFITVAGVFEVTLKRETSIRRRCVASRTWALKDRQQQGESDMPFNELVHLSVIVPAIFGDKMWNYTIIDGMLRADVPEEAKKEK